MKISNLYETHFICIYTLPDDDAVWECVARNKRNIRNSIQKRAQNNNILCVCSIYIHKHLYVLYPFNCFTHLFIFTHMVTQKTRCRRHWTYTSTTIRIFIYELRKTREEKKRLTQRTNSRNERWSRQYVWSRRQETEEGRQKTTGGKKKSYEKQDHQLRRIYKSLRKQQTPTQCIGRRQEKEPGHFSSA